MTNWLWPFFRSTPDPTFLDELAARFQPDNTEESQCANTNLMDFQASWMNFQAAFTHLIGDTD